MPKILYVCEFGTLNGGERSLLAWVPYVAGAGFEPIVLAPSDGLFPNALSSVGFRSISWPTPVSAAQGQRRTALRTLIAGVSPDVVHANSLAMSRLVGPVARELGIPSIGHLRDIVRVSARAMGDINANRCVLAVSQATLAWHAAQGLDATRADVLYNGIDLVKFRPQAASGYLQRELQVPQSAQFVTTIGQIGARKGADVLLSAAAAIADKHPNVHFLVVGERNSGKPEAVAFEQSLHQCVGRLPLRGRVHFLGYRDDMPQLLNESTLLVHAARQEPLGRVLLEAAAAAVPIVATDVGGTREIFGPEAPLIPAQNAQALGAAMSELLNDRQRREKLAEAAHRRIAMLFDIRRSAAKLLDVYRRLDSRA